VKTINLKISPLAAVAAGLFLADSSGYAGDEPSRVPATVEHYTYTIRY